MIQTNVENKIKTITQKFTNSIENVCTLTMQKLIQQNFTKMFIFQNWILLKQNNSSLQI